MRTIFHSWRRDSFVLIFLWREIQKLDWFVFCFRLRGFSSLGDFCFSKRWQMSFFLNILNSMNEAYFDVREEGRWGNFVRVREFYTGDSLLGLITNLLWARFITWGKSGMDQNNERGGRLQIFNVKVSKWSKEEDNSEIFNESLKMLKEEASCKYLMWNS